MQTSNGQAACAAIAVLLIRNITGEDRTMRNPNRAVAAIGVALMIIPASAVFAAQPHRPATGFEEATIIVERNDTDGDTEVVIELTAGDEGLRTLYMRTPDGRSIASVASHDPSSEGMREFHFESPEPEGDAILASYPEGTYVFYGSSTGGERFLSTAELSHSLPAAPTIINPVQDEVVGADALTIQWSSVPGIAQYIVEFENESADPEQTLTVNLPASITSLDVSPALLVPGADYQVGIAAVGKNGNITVTEITFSTAE